MQFSLTAGLQDEAEDCPLLQPKNIPPIPDPGDAVGEGVKSEDRSKSADIISIREAATVLSVPSAAALITFLAGTFPHGD